MYLTLEIQNVVKQANVQNTVGPAYYCVQQNTVSTLLYLYLIGLNSIHVNEGIQIV